MMAKIMVRMGRTVGQILPLMAALTGMMRTMLKSVLNHPKI
jgi:hypothetical protein